MAEVIIGVDEGTNPEALPHVCMRCGEPATMIQRHEYKWNPPWAYPLWRRIIDIPLCELHHEAWNRRTFTGWYSTAAAIASLVSIFLLAALTNHKNPMGILIGTITFLLFAIVAGCCHQTCFSVTNIDVDEMTLKNVSETFRQALRELRRNLREQAKEVGAKRREKNTIDF